jgi:hypothetical protein
MIYCSLGEHCHAATLLKMNGLKLASYPFDWIFSSDQMLKHCIEDNFRTFLDKSEYNTNIAEPYICEHEFYSTMVENHQDVEGKEKVIFNHHNPLTSDQDYGYFERCVTRFRELLASDEEKTFVMFQRGSEDITNGVIKSLMLTKFLKDYTTNFTLLVIHHVIGNNQSYQLIKGENLKFINLKTLSKTLGIGFENTTDDQYLNNIFNEIR